jgi:transcriptional regulator with XRE-family HTH domain
MKELKLRIRKTGMTQKEFCEKVGVKYQAMNSYLNGFNPMPEHVRLAIEDVLKEVQE